MEEPLLLCVENRRVHTQSAQLAGWKLFSTATMINGSFSHFILKPGRSEGIKPDGSIGT